MGKLKKFWRWLGPGLITGAVDDDPSGIATYSIAGAKAGFSVLWTMLYSLPMMIALQEMSARIGLTSRCGLAGNLKRYYPKPLLILFASLIVIANVFNIGADISGMAASVNLLLPNSYQLVSLFLVVMIIFLTIVLPYRKIVLIFKWLSLSLGAYIIAGIFAVNNWPAIFLKTIIPTLKFNTDFFILLLAILGTTISPYLPVWQASEEVEEKKLDGRVTRVCKFRTVAGKEISSVDGEAAFGMFFSNLIGFFIIALTGSVIFSAGLQNIETIQDAAEALRPLAGPYAYWLFAFGLIIAGLLAIPILAGSAAYVIAEVFGWEASLDKPFNKAKGFYLVIITATILGLVITQLGINPIKALFYTAILHGLVGPVLIGALIHMSNNPKIVGPNKSSRLNNFFAYTAVVLLTVGSIFFFTTL